MKVSPGLLSFLRQAAFPRAPPTPIHALRRTAKPNHFPRRHPSLFQRRSAYNPADHGDFVSIVDNPPQLVSTNRKHGAGIYVLAAIPITAFLLGCWQVQRLGWKTELIARFEDRLVRDPLPLPPTIDPSAIHEFDYRRVYAHGRYRHDQEMLIGPRTHDGADGYLVVTPLERDNGSKILVNRGWIAKDKKRQQDRALGVPRGEVEVSGLLREPWKKNLFTPDNKPELGQFYFPDVGMMAELTGSQPVWIEATMRPDILVAMDHEEKGIPIGRAAEVNLRNTHTQYIFTWYALAAATSIMFWMVVKKPPSGGAARVRRNTEW